MVSSNLDQFTGQQQLISSSKERPGRESRRRAIKDPFLQEPGKGQSREEKESKEEGGWREGIPEGDMTISWWGLGTASSWTLTVMLPPVPVTHPRL